MKNKILYMAMMMALAFTACSEDDIMQPANGQSGTLHISSVIIDGQQVARSRVVAENGGTYTINNLPANHSITGFSEGDEIQLYYSFGSNSWEGAAKARFGGSSWTLSGTEIMSATEESTFIIKPGNGKKWEDVKMYASVVPTSAGPRSLGRQAEGSNTTPQYVLGDIDDDDVWQVTDCLYASTEDRSITVDTDLKSPTLGAVTIRFKHQDALLRLPMTVDALNVATGNYIVNGEAYHVTGLATLWAVLDENENYVPFTQVGNNLQAIVDKTEDFDQLLTGFKAVLYTTASGKPGDENYDESEVLTLDLPFKVGGSAREGIELVENTQYPMTLNISPNSAAVTFTTPEGKPGWNVSESQEQELSNADNEFDLKYIAGEGGAAGTFMVKTAQGLQDLNKWMTGDMTTDVFKGKIKCDPANYVFNITEGSTNAKKQNITLAANITLPTVSNGESNWIPIQYYQGTFNGSNKTIRNLTIVDGSIRYIGLIGCLSSTGKVKDVNLENVLIDSRSRVSNPINYVGGIVGQSYADTDEEAEVSGCTVSGKIWGGFSCVGGIVGCTEDGNFIRDCTLVAGSELDAKDFTVGGIVGAMGTNCKVYNCNVSSDIKIGSYKSETAGGIVGRAGNGTLIEKCETAEGSEVKGNMRVAGILADSNSSSTNTCKVIDCINRSNVRLDMETSYEEYIGGIVADGNNIDITNCTNYGALTSDDAVYMGGIIGKGPSCKLENCTNMETATLTVTSKTSNQYTRLGGIIGYARYLVQVKGCMNHAAITHTYNSSQNYIGGIVGEMYNYDNGDGFVACGNTGSITISAMEGVTSSTLYVGGIAGSNNDTDCKYRGCWTKDVVEHYLTADQTTEKDGFGYVYSTNSASSIINSYTASAKTEGTTDQAFINGKTGYTDDETSGKGMSMNKALETLFYASGKPGASLSTKYYWKANTNGGWPTLTTTAPTMPTGN